MQILIICENKKYEMRAMDYWSHKCKIIRERKGQVQRCEDLQ